MAARRNIFATAFMQTGKFLSAWRGWVADWRKMCYLWEHLNGDGGIFIKWNADGSATVSGANVGSRPVLDQKSIDVNPSGETEIKGWSNGTPAGSNSIGTILSGNGGTGEDAELLICRQADGTLIFRAIGSVSGSGGGLSGSFSFLGGMKYDPSSGVHQLQQRVDTVTIGNGQITVAYGSNNAANPQNAQWDMIPGGQAVPLTGG